MGTAPSVALAKVHIGDQRFTVLELAMFLFQRFVEDSNRAVSVRNALPSRGVSGGKHPLTAAGESGRISGCT